MKRRRWLRIAVWVGSAGFVSLNVAACFHARAMIQYTDGGERTKAPEELSFAGKAWVTLTGVRIPRPANGRTPADLGLPFSEERFASEDGVGLSAWRIPVANPRATAILLPGYAAARSTVLPQAALLHAAGFETLLVDPRGVGGSDGDRTTIGFDEAKDVVAAFRRERGRDPARPIILVGESMGAVAILRAVGVHAIEPSAIIVEYPFSSLLTTVGNRFDSMGLPRIPAAALLVFWGSVHAGYNGFGHDPITYARSIRCPTLILNGTDDPRVRRADAEALAAAHAGPCRLQLFEGLGHTSASTARPAAWRDAVGSFLVEALGR